MTTTGQIVKFVILTLGFCAVLWSLSYLSETAEIRNNWDKHRCEPGVIPFASFFGHDTAENFNYCMTYMFRGQAGQFLSPILEVISTVVTIFSTLIRALSSIRLMIANIVNSATSVLADMRNRIMSVMLELRSSLLRMKQLMYRLYATFYAIIFMGMSGLNTAVTFGNSTVGRFLDTFCFHPDTNIVVCGILQKVRDVNVGAILNGPNGERIRVTSKLVFDSRQQKHNMFSLGGIIVSGGHYVEYEQKWIQVRMHPDAVAVAWDERVPIICFNTETGYIPVPVAAGPAAGTWLKFADYDEDHTADEAVMAKHEAILGPRVSNSGPWGVKQQRPDYSLGIGMRSRVRMPDCVKYVKGQTSSGLKIEKAFDWKVAKDIRIGDQTYYGRVLAIIDEECDECVRLSTGDLVSAAILVWNPAMSGYVRAVHLPRSRHVPGKRILRNFIIDGAELMELKGGAFVKDYVEIASADTQKLYDQAMLSVGTPS